MDGWSYKTLPELGELNRGKSKHRPRDAAHLYGGDYPFIQTGDVKASDGRITAYSQTYSEAGLAQSRLWPEETVAITIAANIAETGILTFPACFPDSVVGFIADDGKSNPYFVEYKFQELRKIIQQEHVGSGSVQDNINLAILRTMPFFVPEVNEQNKIATVLRSFDDKIELNRQINETLEALAQTIFKDWFVDFGPVRRKHQGGTDPAAILGSLVTDAARAAEVAAHFPEHFGDDGLPEGWKSAPFSEQIEIIGGGTPKTSMTEYWSGNIPWFSVADTPSASDTFVFETEKSITSQGLENSSTRLIAEGTTIITARGTVGKMAIAGCEMAFNQSCYALRASIDEAPYYIYLATQRMVQRLQSMAHGSVFSTITRQTFENVDAIVPSTPVRAEFESLVASLFKRIKASVSENRALAETRNYLLPKLMSGQVRVRDAEKLVG